MTTSIKTQQFILILATASVLIGCSPKVSSDSSPTFSVVLEGGTVYSGADREPLVTDVGLLGDRINAIGDLSDREAELRLDVSGLAVVPGFIDIHNHAIRDNPVRSGIFRWPDAENMIRQGITTAIGGPDGGSPLPIAEDFAALEAAPSTVNFGTFVGHGSVRELVVGKDDRPASEEEMQGMRDEVEKAMKSGAFGLSSGLLYTPGSFSSTEEVIELAKVAGNYGGIYISHMRNEGLGLFDSIRETIRIGEEGNLPTQITHFKVMGAPMWGKSVEAIAMVDAAIARGVDVSADQYPYPASSTGLTAVFPRWSLDGDTETRNARIEDPVLRAKLKKDIVYRLINDRGGNDPSKVALAHCSWDESLNGLNLAEVLENQSRDVTIENAAELVMELQLAGGCNAVYHAMSLEDVERIMQHPKTMVASDGGIIVPGFGAPHPRNYGAFVRILGHYVRERHWLSFQTAIHKMTQMPADRINLNDRGRIEVGAYADIAVLDPESVTDRATFKNPHQYAEGVHHVFVNGQSVLLNGDMTGRRPGRVLRSQ